jgi:hypothetical protein
MLPVAPVVAANSCGVGCTISHVATIGTVTADGSVPGAALGVAATLDGGETAKQRPAKVAAATPTLNAQYLDMLPFILWSGRRSAVRTATRIYGTGDATPAGGPPYSAPKSRSSFGTLSVSCLVACAVKTFDVVNMRIVHTTPSVVGDGHGGRQIGDPSAGGTAPTHHYA